MGDEKDPSATSASEPAASVAPPGPVSVVPRPVSVVPRPVGTSAPTSRMPPPPSSRGIMPGLPTPSGPRALPPPPPLAPAAAAAGSFGAGHLCGAAAAIGPAGFRRTTIAGSRRIFCGAAQLGGSSERGAAPARDAAATHAAFASAHVFAPADSAAIRQRYGAARAAPGRNADRAAQARE